MTTLTDTIGADVMEKAKDCWINLPVRGDTLDIDMECVFIIARALQAARNEERERCANCQPSTAEDPNESAYQRGRFDGIMEFARAIREGR